MTEIIVAVLSSSGISGLLGWFFGRNKQKAEVTGTELDNVAKAVEIWRELATDLDAKLEKVNATCEQLQGEISRLRQENKELRSQMKKLDLSINKAN